MNNEYIFSLDIGTRSIVGVVAEKEEDTMRVVDVKSVFHRHRAMVDGQIEDIEKVSKVIEEVKSFQENKLNVKFDKVYIAAAGRSLNTEKITYEKVLNSKVPISEEIKTLLEMEALQMAHDVFHEKSGVGTDYYCVGYSVLSYLIDDYSMTNILGHRGEKISIEIIAAFLPHHVVEGLYSCMDSNNLEVASLTLEPIAAMNLVIPKDLRLLNIALVDIGAGTSDIAISKNGSIVGYDMSTTAGDEITESIMKAYLVDFNTAEKIKISLSDENDTVIFKDILGLEQNIPKTEVISSMENAVSTLCKDIATKILAMNNEAPVALFLIGGGSKAPNMKKHLAQLLDLPENRISIGSEDTVKSVNLSHIENFGPELITPVGIAYSSVLGSNYDFFSVVVNGKKVRLYNIRQMKVMDALLMAGFDTTKLIGLSSKNLSFTLNNKNYFYKGDYSTPAEILVNSVASNIETKLSPGDVIEVISAKDGEAPVVKISDIVEPSQKGSISFNNNKVTLGARYMINNIEVGENYIIGNSDIIEIVNITKLFHLLELFELNEDDYSFFYNGNKIETSYDLIDGMTIDIVRNNTTNYQYFKSEEQIDKDTVVHDIELNNTVRIILNGEDVSLQKKHDGSPILFADVILHTGIDPTKPQGKIIIKHNDMDASYTAIVNEGDNLIIKWQNQVN